MAETFASSNPFRRKTPSTTPSIPQEPQTNINHIAYQQAVPLADSTNLPKIDVPKKATKKVRVQSPPPPSPSTPSLPDSSSTIGDDIYAKPPTRIPRDDDPFDSTTSDMSDSEVEIKRSQAPLNPFSKTLETMEHPERDASAHAPTNITSPGRASMDVEAFKRLLMTGNAGLGISTPPIASAAHLHHGLGDGGSSTDASSVSRQSIFEPIQELHTETPRTSHDLSEPDDDRRNLPIEPSSPVSARKAPPPPSSRHGKLIKVELRDDPAHSNIPLVSPQPPTPGSATSSHSQFFTASPPNRSNTDLNKPLPPAPSRRSHESDRESIFDTSAAGKTPEPPSPSTSLRRKTPPAPPVTRRHSQLVSASKITQDTGRLSPKVEEDTIPSISSHIPSMASTGIEGRPRSDSAKSQASTKSTQPPPPPPTRRPASVRQSSHNVPLTSPSAISLPPPTPPARGSSRSISGRPPSVVSMDMGFGLAREGSKRISMAPPPPPPHRHGRGSMDDGSRRTSTDLRRPSGEMARKESVDDVPTVEGTGGVDILADITRLQREIDELRIQSERGTA